MKNILFYILPFLLIGCSDTPDIEECSDPIKKIVYLLTESPDEWTVENVYERNHKHTHLTYAETGVVITKSYKREYSWDEWEDSEDLGWRISKPHSLKLSDEENQIIEASYLIWEDVRLNDARCEISNALGNIPNDIKKNNPKHLYKSN
jgi:hypothetical protein